jgi:ATP-binding cassette subfamily B (MDR/TAP) protein 1
MMVLFWTMIGKRLILKISEEYLKVIMRQEPGWFDNSNVFELPTKVQSQLKIIEGGIGNKVGQAIMAISQFAASFLVGYITSWQLSLVLTAMLPLLLIGGWFMAKAMQQGGAVNRESYEKAGGIAEEVIYQIRTVASFVNYDYEKDKYKSYIQQSMEAGIKSGFKAGFGIGFIIFVVYCSYSLAVGYGSHLIYSQEVNDNNGQIFGSGDVITVLFSIIFGCLSLGQATPYVRAMYEAMLTASEFFDLLNRKPLIDMSNSSNKPPKNEIKGEIMFKNVNFAYPTNLDKTILNNFNIRFEQGKKTAIVGASGSGKSTIIYLIQRFYEPSAGSVYIDNYDIKSLDLKYWRSMVGYVSQEPVLFNTSIENNIIFGRENITQEDIKTAVEKAYANNFVDNLGLDYVVGIKGGKLSGGQKQRIAIARAILTKPKILILDEATSALDNEGEKEVQAALDQVCKDLTTIIIAHKIETIMNSDTIVCLNDGHIVEQGTHNELLQAGGYYYTLFNTTAEKQRKERKEMVERQESERNRLNSKRKEDELISPRDEFENAKFPAQFKTLYGTKLSMGEKKSSLGTENIVLKYSGLNDTYLHKNLERVNSEKRNSNSVNEPASNRSNRSNLQTEKLKEIVTEPQKVNIKTDLEKQRFSELRKRLMSLLKNDKYFVIGGAIAASCNGAVWPIYGILLADAIGTLADPEKEMVKEGGMNVAIMFFALAIAAAVILWMQKYIYC